MICLNFFLGFSGVVLAAKRALVPRAALKGGSGGAHQKSELVQSLFFFLEKKQFHQFYL